MGDDIFFSTIGVVLVPFIVAVIMFAADKTGFVWAKLNQPSIAAIVGGILGLLYHIEYVYQVLNGKVPDGTLATYIVGGITVGLAAAGAKSLAKDITSGAIKTTTREQVMDMRTRARAQSRTTRNDIGE